MRRVLALAVMRAAVATESRSNVQRAAGHGGPGAAWVGLGTGLVLAGAAVLLLAARRRDERGS